VEGIKIEAGKYYRTREGKQAFVAALAQSPFDKDPVPYIGYVKGHKLQEQFWWSEAGRAQPDGNEDPFDLVAEWQEPKRIRGWLNVFACASTGFYTTGVWETKEAADSRPGIERRLACIEIDVLEGQGLDGSAS